MLAYYSMNSLENHEFSYFKVRMSSLTLLSSSYYELKKLVEKSLDVYKLMEEENSLAQYIKTSVMREVSILAIRFHIYTKKMV